jgi:hypothetical protein
MTGWTVFGGFTPQQLSVGALLLLASLVTQAPVASQATVRVDVQARNGSAEDPRKRFGPDQIAMLEALTRADADHLSRIDMLVVPDVWRTDLQAYSPFPAEYAWGAGHSKLLVVDQASQAFAGYEFGRQVRWGPVNTGRQSSQTPSGLFHLN